MYNRLHTGGIVTREAEILIKGGTIRLHHTWRKNWGELSDATKHDLAELGYKVIGKVKLYDNFHKDDYTDYTAVRIADE
jgi:hypothetical protein